LAQGHTGLEIEVLPELLLTLLAPDFVEAILDGRQMKGMTLPVFTQPCPAEWALQRDQRFSPWLAAVGRDHAVEGRLARGQTEPDWECSASATFQTAQESNSLAGIVSDRLVLREVRCAVQQTSRPEG